MWRLFFLQFVFSCLCFFIVRWVRWNQSNDWSVFDSAVTLSNDRISLFRARKKTLTIKLSFKHKSGQRSLLGAKAYTMYVLDIIRGHKNQNEIDSPQMKELIDEVVVRAFNMPYQFYVRTLLILTNNNEKSAKIELDWYYERPMETVYQSLD